MTHDLPGILLHGFTLFRAETTQLPAAVQAWMWVMRIVLGTSIAFLPRRGAVATIGVMLVTAVSRFYVKGLHPGIPAAHIGASVHLVLWVPLVIFLIWTMRAPRRPGGPLLDRAYPVWRIAAIAVMAISLAFDVREVIGMLA